MSYRVVVGPRAEAEADELIAWWTRNRPAARSLQAEIKRLLELLERHPEIGARFENRHMPGARRLGIQGTPYSLYYVVVPDESLVRILSFWSSMRGRGPSL